MLKFNHGWTNGRGEKEYTVKHIHMLIDKINVHLKHETSILNSTTKDLKEFEVKVIEAKLLYIYSLNKHSLILLFPNHRLSPPPHTTEENKYSPPFQYKIPPPPISVCFNFISTTI